MGYGFVVFMAADDTVDWRQAGGALPKGSTPVLAVGRDGARAVMHGLIGEYEAAILAAEKQARETLAAYGD